MEFKFKSQCATQSGVTAGAVFEYLARCPLHELQGFLGLVEARRRLRTPSYPAIEQDARSALWGRSSRSGYHRNAKWPGAKPTRGMAVQGGQYHPKSDERELSLPSGVQLDPPRGPSPIEDQARDGLAALKQALHDGRLLWSNDPESPLSNNSEWEAVELLAEPATPSERAGPLNEEGRWSEALPESNDSGEYKAVSPKKGDPQAQVAEGLEAVPSNQMVSPRGPMPSGPGKAQYTPYQEQT